MEFVDVAKQIMKAVSLSSMQQVTLECVCFRFLLAKASDSACGQNPQPLIRSGLACYRTSHSKMLTEGVLMTIGIKHFNYRTAESIIGWQKERSKSASSFLLFPKGLLYTAGSLNPRFHFCKGRSCLFLASQHKKASQHKSCCLTSGNLKLKSRKEHKFGTLKLSGQNSTPTRFFWTHQRVSRDSNAYCLYI